MEPRSLYVAVQDGIVSLSGTVERYGMISLVEAPVRRVDGVVEVRGHLKSERDDRDIHPDEPVAGGWFGRRSPYRP